MPFGHRHYAVAGMSSLDSLPGDQRAVLQLVLSRGRSYDEIAQLLSIDRAHTLPAELIHCLLGLAQASQAATLWFVDADAYRRAETAGRVAADIPVNHSARFAPALQPTLDTGTQALVVAATAWLGRSAEATP